MRSLGLYFVYGMAVAVAAVGRPLVVEMALQFTIGVACAGPAWIGLQPGRSARSV